MFAFCIALLLKSRGMSASTTCVCIITFYHQSQLVNSILWSKDLLGKSILLFSVLMVFFSLSDSPSTYVPNQPFPQTYMLHPVSKTAISKFSLVKFYRLGTIIIRWGILKEYHIFCLLIICGPGIFVRAFNRKMIDWFADITCHGVSILVKWVAFLSSSIHGVVNREYPWFLFLELYCLYPPVKVSSVTAIIFIGPSIIGAVFLFDIFTTIRIKRLGIFSTFTLKSSCYDSDGSLSIVIFFIWSHIELYFDLSTVALARAICS